jgi:hypothetical protein
MNIAVKQPVYKKTFEAYEFFDALELPTMGGISPAHPMSIMAVPAELNTMLQDVNERLQKEISDFEKEEGDITIVGREPRLSIVCTLDGGCEYKPALNLEIEVSFTHEDDASKQ